MEREIISSLEKALAEVRSRLLSTDVKTPGYGEIRSMYNILSASLIRVAHKKDDEIAAQLNIAAEEIVEEWESNKAILGNWTGELKTVVEAVGKVLKVAGLSNPLVRFLN